MFILAIIILVLTSAYRTNPTVGKQSALRVLSYINLFFVITSVLPIALSVLSLIPSLMIGGVTDTGTAIAGLATGGVSVLVNVIVSIIASVRALKAIKEITPTSNTFVKTYTDQNNRYTDTYSHTAYTAPTTVVQNEKPEWKCNYCGRMNKGDDPDCDGCGAPRAS